MLLFWLRIFVNVPQVFPVTKYHRAKLVNDRGDIIPLCRVRSMRKVDLSVESWTIRNDAVTCRRCQKLIEEGALNNIPAEESHALES
jgi:hypothetical protein